MNEWNEWVNVHASGQGVQTRALNSRELAWQEVVDHWMQVLQNKAQCSEDAASILNLWAIPLALASPDLSQIRLTVLKADSGGCKQGFEVDAGTMQKIR